MIVLEIKAHIYDNGMIFMETGAAEGNFPDPLKTVEGSNALMALAGGLIRIENDAWLRAQNIVEAP